MDNILQRRSQNSFKTNLTNMSTSRSKTVQQSVYNFTSNRGEQHTGKRKMDGTVIKISMLSYK